MESQEPVTKKPTFETKCIITDLGVFIEPFEEYIRPINEQDADTLKNDFYGGKDDEWHNEKGTYAIKMRELVKKYFPTVKVNMVPWSVPQCAGGIFFVIEADQQTLDDILQKVKMEKDYKIGDGKEAADMMAAFTC